MARLRFAALLVLFPAVAGAQRLHGTVRDSATRQAISGVVLTLLDSSGVMIGRMLSGESGQYHIPRRTGIARIRWQRLGYRLRQVLVPASDSTDIQLDVAMTALSTLLEPVRVVAAANCPRRSDGDAALILLEQARAGLLTLVVARDSNPGSLVRLVYRRELDRSGRHIVSQRVNVDSAKTTVSFISARSGAEFVRLGFTLDTLGQRVYYGPDADVLLDDGFTNGYCFHIMDPTRDRATQIGLGFAPADRKRGRIDIEGALWIDTVARALHDIEFRFVGLTPTEERMQPGGQTFFREMTNGVVLIERWSLRSTTLQADTAKLAVNRPSIIEWALANDGGGELARATWPDGTTWRASLGRLRVRATLRDGRPAIGAVVALDHTDYWGVADSSGTVVIEDLVPGPYTALVIEPRLADLGLTMPTPLAFVAARDSTSEEKLTVESLEQFIFGRCSPKKNREAPEGTYLIGRVVGPTGLPVGDADVTIAIVRGDPFYRYTTGTDGIFPLCLAKSDLGSTVTIQAQHKPEPPATIQPTLSKSVTLVRLVIH